MVSSAPATTWPWLDFYMKLRSRYLCKASKNVRATLWYHQAFFSKNHPSIIFLYHAPNCNLELVSTLFYLGDSGVRLGNFLLLMTQLE